MSRGEVTMGRGTYVDAYEGVKAWRLASSDGQASLFAASQLFFCYRISVRYVTFIILDPTTSVLHKRYRGNGRTASRLEPPTRYPINPSSKGLISSPLQTRFDEWEMSRW